MQESTEASIIDISSSLRKEIKEVAVKVVNLKSHSSYNGPMKDRLSAQEELSNIMLAYRHLEDAAMRLGKVIQAADGGTSVYDK